jgi:hypothetical protein
MKKTAVEYLINELFTIHDENFDFNPIFEQAKIMEEKQLVMSANTSLKEAYEAGQKSMYCGCYSISDCSSFNDWFYETFKSE